MCPSHSDVRGSYYRKLKLVISNNSDKLAPLVLLPFTVQLSLAA
jgi:hypothetical protein